MPGVSVGWQIRATRGKKTQKLSADTNQVWTLVRYLISWLARSKMFKRNRKGVFTSPLGNRSQGKQRLLNKPDPKEGLA